MKEATGELSMTVISIVAIVAIATFVTVVLWPRVKTWIDTQWGKLESNPESAYVEKVDIIEFNM